MKTPNKSTCSSSIFCIIVVSFTILINYSINGWSCYLGGQEEKHELSESMDTEGLASPVHCVSYAPQVSAAASQTISVTKKGSFTQQ